MAHVRRQPRDRWSSPALVERKCSTAGLDGEEAGVVGNDTERRRQLDSSAWHQRRLQRWPESLGTWRRTLAELGRFRGREEERRVGIGSGEGVLLLGVDGGFL
jgi:hypothetical protein